MPNISTKFVSNRYFVNNAADKQNVQINNNGPFMKPHVNPLDSDYCLDRHQIAHTHNVWLF